MPKKKWILRFRVKDKKNFEEVRRKEKIVETRAATEKYRKVQKGDALLFVCGDDLIEKKVKKVALYMSIDSMLKSIPRTRVMPSTKNVQEMKVAYHSYPGYKEKIKKYGLVAFYL